MEIKFEQTISGYTFKMIDGDMVEVYNGDEVVCSFRATGVETQKDFDKEISYWYMANGANI